MWKMVIVDDDRYVLQAMRRAIPWQSLEAECVAECLDGREGLEAVERFDPDIVLTDIYMPVMDGLEMIERLRDGGYKGKIFILSGYSDFEYARKALRLDVEDYLSKPLSVDTLESVLGKVVGKLEEEASRRLEDEDLRGKLRLYEPFVEKEWITSLLTGTMDPAELAGYAARNSRLTDRAHLVMAVEIVRTLQDSTYTNADWNLLRFAVTNIVKELLAEAWPGSEIVELQSHFMAVLLQGEPGIDPEEAAVRIRETAREMIRCVGQYLRLQLQIGVGRWKERWTDIPNSTEEAFRALSLKRYSPLASVDLFELERCEEAAGGGEAPSDFRPIQLYQKFADAARISENRLQSVVEEWTRQLAEREPIKPSSLQQQGLEIWAMLSYALEDVGLAAAGPQDIRLEMKSILSAGQLRDWFAEKIGRAYAGKPWNEKIRYKEAVDFMVEYIHEHYAEDISLSQLAEKVFISRNYLAQMFRESTGETFNTYLTKVRMNQAKKLLQSGKYRIYQVSELVGYKNVPYFSTLFKKVTGLNPSDLAK